jgi:hypothetical protein
MTNKKRQGSESRSHKATDHDKISTRSSKFSTDNNLMIGSATGISGFHKLQLAFHSVAILRSCEHDIHDTTVFIYDGQGARGYETSS